MTEPTSPHPIVRVVCKSLSPMLQDYSVRYTHRETAIFERDGIEKLPRRERAATTLYRGPNGELGFPFEVLSAAMNSAARLQKKQGSEVPLIRMPFREFVPFDPGTLHPDWDHPTEPKNNIRDGWAADMRTTRQGNCTRAKFPTWGFTAFCYVTSLDQATLLAVRTLFNLTGLSCGLGAYRPAQGGPFGTFTVVEVAPEPSEQV